MTTQENNQEEDDTPMRPAYLDNPIARQYIDLFRNMILDMDEQIDGTDQPPGIYELRNVLMALHDQIDYQANLYEVERIFRIQFASFFSAPTADVRDALIEQPMTTSN